MTEAETVLVVAIREYAKTVGIELDRIVLELYDRHGLRDLFDPPVTWVDSPVASVLPA